MFIRFLKSPKNLFLLALAILAIYGTGRLYYRVTGGFMESNIVYDLAYDSRWNIPELSSEEKKNVEGILSQEYHYLGKGCQSYVFVSSDNKYVLKFFKYQRFRPQAWLDYFAFIPFVDQYRLDKIEKKKLKLENVFLSWKLAYEKLQPETGVVYVHLNKRPLFNKAFAFYDKIGLKHELKLDNLEFMVQKKANMLCTALLENKEKGDHLSSQQLIDRLLNMLISEYERGYADNDHALMQNTGILDGMPIHIDIGQFVKNPIVMDIPVRNQELFNKTWKFRIWLKKEYPELDDYIEKRLSEIIGESFFSMKPILYQSGVGRIPHIP